MNETERQRERERMRVKWQNIDYSMTCEICGESTVEWECCDKCGKRVCRNKCLSYQCVCGECCCVDCEPEFRKEHKPCDDKYMEEVFPSWWNIKQQISNWWNVWQTKKYIKKLKGNGCPVNLIL